MSENAILIESPCEGVQLIRLNRPKQLNALNAQLLSELKTALDDFETRDDVKAVVLTGSEKAFAAGADITELMGKNADQMKDLISHSPGWHAVSNFSKPVIGAVSGMALGGGFELALQCDILIASKGAKFGLPEVKLGVIPGAAGTQRILPMVGKSLAMEMVLNARLLSSSEALHYGIISQEIEPSDLEKQAIQLASGIASQAVAAVRAGKACINKGLLESLTEGMTLERELFSPLFDTEEAKFRINEFVNKGK